MADGRLAIIYMRMMLVELRDDITIDMSLITPHLSYFQMLLFENGS